MRAVFQMVLGLLVFWLLVLLYMNSTLHQSDGISNQMQSQLENALNELDGLKKQNEKLRSLAQDLKNYMNFNSASKNKQQARITNLDNPMKGHEVLRRSVENGVVEFWYHVSSQLGYIKKDLDGQQTNSAQNRIQDLIDAGADHQRYLLKDLFNLTMLSDDWRKKESDSLGRLVQSRISFLQNPKDCSKARKLVCNINKGCGYGCQLHHLVYCFLIAYGTERTLILESRGWRYSTYGWEKYFLPLSNTCVDRSGASSHGWGKNTDDTQVVELPIVDSLHPRPPYMPLAIPKDLSDRLIALHGNPFVWWCGQFIKYLTRPQPSLAEDMKNVGSKLNFKNPIVGVHVRRTDKIGSEAAFHNLHEYMSHVDDYFSRLELQRTVDVRRVYLATDDPGVLDEARTQYPLYEFIGDASFSKTASVSSRYSDESLRAIILDIHFLSLSDYLVCTFSSQVCRVAYEIMQTLHPDAANQFKSLDDVYYFGGQTGHNQIAIAAHKARSDEEIDLLPGDIIGVAGNHWDGFSKGRNQRTGRTGIYPSYKVQEHWNIVSFPTYPEVPDDS